MPPSARRATGHGIGFPAAQAKPGLAPIPGGPPGTETPPNRQAGADYALTPALRIDGNVGPTFADTSAKEPGGTSGSTVGALWDVNLSYQPSADASFGVGVFQEFDPQSVDGALNFRTGITSTFDYALTRYTSFALSTLVQRQDPIEGDAETRYFSRAQPSLSFRVLPRVRLSASYRFRWQTFDDGGGATSNAVFVNLAYDLPSLLTSR